MGAFDDLDLAAYTSASLQDDAFTGNIGSNLFEMGVERGLWTNPLQTQLDTSFIPFQDTRHMSASSSEYSPTSLSSLPTTAAEDFSFRPLDNSLTMSMPFSMSVFTNMIREQNSLRAASGINSPGSSTASGEFQNQEYLTAKEKSLLHRRKQNRAAQRTFRQRKEVERLELQARLEAALKSTTDLQSTCDELNETLEKLRERVKALEEENSALKERHRPEKEKKEDYFNMKKDEKTA